MAGDQRMVSVLGSTGSIGVNTLDVIARHPERFQVRVCGERLRGQVTLTRRQNDDWEFVYSLASE